jgi:GTP-binding protein
VYTLEEDHEEAWNAERLSAHHFAVTGRRIERAMRMTDFALDEAADRFQRILEASGVSARLEDLGIEPGDVVHIADSELVWEPDLVEDAQAGPPQRVRKTRRQRLEEQFGAGDVEPDADERG